MCLQKGGGGASPRKLNNNKSLGVIQEHGRQKTRVRHGTKEKVTQRDDGE